MSSKDEILTAIRQNTVQRYEYPDWEIKATVYPDKISRFYEISQFVGGKAVVLQEAEDINDIIRSHFPEARKIASQMEEITCATIRPDTLAEAQELDGTDVAVVEGAFGVAENGAVWIPQNVKHKALYFIAEALVIVLDRHSLVHNMQEAYELLAGQTYPFGTFISGPSKTADIEQALEYMTNSIKKRCTCFVISDFIDEHDFAHALAIANRKHDVVALRVYDPRENQLPPVGMMYLRDAETGEQMWVDTSDKKLREAYEKYAFVREKELDAIFKRSGVDVANIRSDEDYVRALITLFKKRA